MAETEKQQTWRNEKATKSALMAVQQNGLIDREIKLACVVGQFFVNMAKGHYSLRAKLMLCLVRCYITLKFLGINP